jgi:repressor LexA
MNLTPRQHDIVQFIRVYTADHDYAPTMQEIANHLGVSRPTVFEHIEALEARGALTRQRTISRAIELVPELALKGGKFRLVGRIAAGRPIEAIEDPEVLDVENLFRGRTGEVFALQVAGNSMIDEHIRDGDFVIVEKRDNAANGDTVVALIDGSEATLKKFYQELGRVRLQPANPTIEPLFLDAARVQVQGVVIGVLRKY